MTSTRIRAKRYGSARHAGPPQARQAGGCARHAGPPALASRSMGQTAVVELHAPTSGPGAPPCPPGRRMPLSSGPAPTGPSKNRTLRLLRRCGADDPLGAPVESPVCGDDTPQRVDVRIEVLLIIGEVAPRVPYGAYQLASDAVAGG